LAKLILQEAPLSKPSTTSRRGLLRQQWQSVADDLRSGSSSAEAALKHEISLRTVQRIRQRTNRQGRVRPARQPGPAPGSVGSATPPALVELVCEFKRHEPGKGHHYCHHWLRRQGHSPPAPVTIWRIWRRHKLLGQRKRRRRARGSWEQLQSGPGYFQIDTAYAAGGSFVLAAVETQSRWALAAVIPRRDSASAALFLEQLAERYPGLLRGVQTDNGGEFAGAFSAACKRRGLPHYLAWVRCPDMNGKVERFIGTLRRESLLGTDDPTLSPQMLAADLQRCLAHYNTQRPHYALGWRTPQECLILDQSQSSTQPP
jgi:hypothetical protein